MYRLSRSYHLLVAITATALLVIAVFFQPTLIQNSIVVLLAAGTCLLLTLLPVYIGSSAITLIPVVTITIGVIFNLTSAALGVAIGIITGYGTVWLLRVYTSGKKDSIDLLQIAFQIGLQIIPLSLVLFITQIIPLSSSSIENTRIYLASTLFVIFHGLLYAFDKPFRIEIKSASAWRKWLSLIVIELLLLTISIVGIQAYSTIQNNILAGLFFIIILISLALNRIGVTRIRLERHLHELSTLNTISLSLSSTIQLSDLLEVLQSQVTQFLGVNNFYIALYDSEQQEIWYPFAVKFGERVKWARRSKAERLTDRVILEQKPILIPKNAQKELVRTGMPPGDDALYSWMGVPLISEGQAVGCLGVFSITHKVDFTEDDLQLLTTIAGQLSVAIENSLLYEQAHQRSAQMETLNQLSNLLTANLDLKNMLVQICKSVAQVTEAHQSAIFLTDDEGKLYLAHAEGISEGDQVQIETIFVGRWQKTSWETQFTPRLVRDAYTETLQPDEIESLQNLDILAWGNFPLTTPSGTIGFLTVYFNAPYTLPLDQVELLETFAAQAAMAVQNARLYTLTDQALEVRMQQIAILEAVGRRLLANLDMEQLLPLILDYAIEFTRSPWGLLGIYQSQDNQLEVKAQRGYTFSQKFWSVEDSVTGKAIQSRSLINLSDTAQDPLYRDVTEGKTHSQLSVPLIYEDQIKGVITLESDHYNAYGENEESLVVQLANSAALAINNAQLYNELQRRLREQSTLYVVTSHLVSSIDPDNLLSFIREAIESAIQPIHTGVYLYTETEDQYILTYPTLPDELPEKLAGNVFELLVPISINVDILKAPSSDFNLREQLKTPEFARGYIIPLESKNQKLGAILLHLQQDQLLQVNTVQLLQSIAAQSTIALENALLFSDVLAARERLSTILNTIQEGILVIDTTGKIVLVNQPVHLFAGQEIEGLIGTQLTQLPTQYLNVLGFTSSQAADISNQLKLGVVLESPKTFIQSDKNMSDRILERTIIPVKIPGGKVAGAMIILHDKTEEHKIQQTRETITDTLIHDLRSPLTAVRAALDILSESAEDLNIEDELALQALSLGQSNAQKVLKLVDSLMEIARMQSGEIELELKKLDLHSMVDQIIKNYSILANEYGVFISNEIPKNFPNINADHEKIERVFSNLIDNGLKYTPAGGKITVSGNCQEHNQVIIQIIDTGPGIPEEYRETIFERFQKVPNQTSRRHGTGLGLAFCQLVIEAHGGNIWVEANQPVGSTFVINLPAMPLTE